MKNEEKRQKGLRLMNLLIKGKIHVVCKDWELLKRVEREIYPENIWYDGHHTMIEQDDKK